MSETPRQTLPVGTRIGVYEVRRILGADYTGITYQAWNQHLNTEMVLKEYFPRGLVTRADDKCTVAPNSESDQTLFEFGLERFLVEAEDLVSMEHPNVVRVLNCLQIYGTAYQIMEYEKGVALEKLIEHPETQLDEDQLKLILLPLLDALEKVHRAGFIHGDINPRTILLKTDGEPVLLNFARTRLAMARSRGELTEVLSEVYAPAEQFEEQDSDRPQSDLYALGATMYRCITGKPPVPGRERLSAVNRGESDPQGPIEMSDAPGCGEGFLNCIDTMMSLEAEQRPKSATEVAEKLGVPGQEDVQTVQKTAVKESVETRSAQPLSFQARSPIPLMVATALGVVVLIAAALWYTRQDGSHSDAVDLEDTREIVVAGRGDAPESDQIGSKDTPFEGPAQGQDKSGISSQITDVAPEQETGAGITPEPMQSTVPDPTSPTAQATLPPQGEVTPESETSAEKSSQGSIFTGPKPPEQIQAGKEPSANETAEVIAQGPHSGTEGTNMDSTASAPVPQQEIDASSKVSEAAVESIPIEKGTQGRVSAKSEVAGDTAGEVADIAHGTSPDESPKVTEVISSIDEGSQDLSGRDEVGSEPKPDEAMVSAIESTQEESSGADQLTSGNGTAKQTRADVVQVPLQKARQHKDLEGLIADRMASAEADLVALRLTTPEGENAMEHYQAILELLPNHSGALAGMQRIVDTYVWMIDTAISKGRYAVAKLYLDRAEEIIPGAPGLERSRRNLSAAQTSTLTE